MLKLQLIPRSSASFDWAAAQSLHLIVRSPLSWKWKIPLQIPHPTPPQPRLQKSCRPHLETEAATLALQNTVVLKKTHTQMKSQSTSPGCTAASLRYGKPTQTTLRAKKTCVMQHNSVSKDTHTEESPPLLHHNIHTSAHTQAAPFESFVAITRQIWGFRIHHSQLWNGKKNKKQKHTHPLLENLKLTISRNDPTLSLGEIVPTQIHQKGRRFVVVTGGVAPWCVQC